ncbi:MarR family winged helix-turn-helix transcriptional regulator [Tannockella kyphosi]|uniref:MarR family winged helix-turn-helix transcriptional regulator n=1 Tax=Tannockella kyphosi TaxID=2899121 RepID=UPI002012B322|nr:MarR family transcriptional regulator [Tannockella kyphosi]
MRYEKHFLYCFRQISEKIEKKGNVKLKDLDLTITQGHILAYLRHKEEFQASYKEIEAVAKVAQSSAASMIARLEAHGFVRTFTNEADRRIKLLELTERGKSCTEAAGECMDELQEELFEKFTEKETETLFALLHKIID